MATNDGTIITDGKGNYRIMKGWQWQTYTGPPPKSASGIGGARGGQQDVIFLNKLSEAAGDANEVTRLYRRAAKDISAFGTGPYRGTMMDVATPQDNGGFFDKLGSVVVGAPLRLTGAITGKDTDNFQKLQSLQQYRVLAEQTRQKGVQTEGDAARIKLAEISPTKTIDANMDVVRNGIGRMMRVQARAPFYTQWTNKYGLHGLNPQGENVDQAWAKNADSFTQGLFGTPDDFLNKGNPSANIKVLSRTKVR